MPTRRFRWLVLVVQAGVLLLMSRAASGYIHVAYSLSRIMNESSNIMVVRVEKVDREKNLIIYRKVTDLKGKHPEEIIRHEIGQRGLHPREWQNIMAWAEVGKSAVFFHNGASGELCLDRYWYQVSAGDWWRLVHAEPYFLLAFSGRPEQLAAAVTSILAGQEVIVPCLMGGDIDALHLCSARPLRLKASLALQDYNLERDFVGWGTEELTRIADMPGFSHYFPLARMGHGAGGVAIADFDADGRPDFCLFGESRVVLLRTGNDGTFTEVPLPLVGGARSAAWADYDGDGKLDLLLATPRGPRLLANDGGKFRDMSAGLPGQSYYDLSAAAWIDQDGDGRPDILLADGFQGLRLYRNRGTNIAERVVRKIGNWYYAGPFDNPGGNGFGAVYPPEKEIDLARQYEGKNAQKVRWQEGKFTDGQVNDLAIFTPECNENCVVYLCREFQVSGSVELPVSLGSDDTLTVWLNGQKLVEQNVYRGCAPDQALVTLKLVPGRNTLLLKICQGGGAFGFYYAARDPAQSVPPLFDDVSDAVGLGADGAGGRLKGYHLAVADVNGDGRPDFLYGAGTGLLLMNTGRGFVEAANSGISYRPDRTTPAFGDFNGDHEPDLFVPQGETCKLFLNNGKGRFTDVTAKAGLPDKIAGFAVSAVWADFNNRGKLDLLVGCLKGPNRCYRNNGDGTFTDETVRLGLSKRIFNTRGIGVADFNKDGLPDVVMNNEGQEPVVLLGNPARLAVAVTR